MKKSSEVGLVLLTAAGLASAQAPPVPGAFPQDPCIDPVTHQNVCRSAHPASTNWINHANDQWKRRRHKGHGPTTTRGGFGSTGAAGHAGS